MLTIPIMPHYLEVEAIPIHGIPEEPASELIRFTRLAVDYPYQGQRLGEQLLIDAISRYYRHLLQ